MGHSVRAPDTAYRDEKARRWQRYLLGAGKTTLLRLLTAELMFDEAEALLEAYLFPADDWDTPLRTLSAA